MNNEKLLIVSSCMSICPSVCPHASARLPLNEFLGNLILGTSMNICLESQNLVEIGLKYRALYTKRAVRSAFYFENNADGDYSRVPVAAHNVFILLAATHKSTTVQRENVVTFLR